MHRKTVMMAARLLSRSKALAALRSPHHLRPLTHGLFPPPPTAGCVPADIPSPAVGLARGLLGSHKIWGYEQISPRHLNQPLHAGAQTLPGGAKRHQAYNVNPQLYHSAGNDKFTKTVSGNREVKGADESDPLNTKNDCTKVISFSPLEGTIKGRVSGLSNESLKIKRTELSQKITYALIPALLIISKTNLTTSLLIFSVFWQIYGFFKEIFLDYVHQEVTRKWVLIYFKLFLMIVAKDMFVYFGLV